MLQDSDRLPESVRLATCYRQDSDQWEVFVTTNPDDGRVFVDAQQLDEAHARGVREGIELMADAVEYEDGAPHLAKRAMARALAQLNTAPHDHTGDVDVERFTLDEIKRAVVGVITDRMGDSVFVSDLVADKLRDRLNRAKMNTDPRAEAGAGHDSENSDGA